MKVCPIPDIEIETLLKNLRKAFLFNAFDPKDLAVLQPLQISLALQCQVNEFIYEESIEETKAVKALETKLAKSTAINCGEYAYHIACLGSYRSLSQYHWSKSLEHLHSIEDLYRRLILEPSKEVDIRKSIPRFGVLKNKTSKMVRKQYEESPYPRWINTAVEPVPYSIPNFLSRTGLRVVQNDRHLSKSPEILVAGCGTGQNAIATASCFQNCFVTAFDLSLTSLAYAKRKTDELNLRNIDYFHGDILDVSELNRKFDIIECVGVLHHMSDPELGLEKLMRCLKPGGLMKLGLYSSRARHWINQARSQIELMKLQSTPVDMRKFRDFIINSNNPNYQNFTRQGDFFSLSSVRDLFFHIHEHQFSLPQLEKLLLKHGLDFIGFDLGKQSFRADFLETFLKRTLISI